MLGHQEMEILSQVEYVLTESRFEPVWVVFDGAIVCLSAEAESLTALNLGVLSAVENFVAFDLSVLHLSRTQPTDSS